MCPLVLWLCHAGPLPVNKGLCGGLLLLLFVPTFLEGHMTCAWEEERKKCVHLSMCHCVCMYA